MRISLDDFGTGQSSLGRLRDFTFDKLKIDRSFVSRIATDRASEHIIKAIVTMCDGLNLEVVAEGIEDFAEALKLKGLGCGMGQGYFYGKRPTFRPRCAISKSASALSTRARARRADPLLKRKTAAPERCRPILRNRRF